MDQMQLDPQHVINSLVRQISEHAQKIAMLEAILEQQQKPADKE
jgi:hypothetical protein